MLIKQMLTGSAGYERSLRQRRRADFCPSSLWLSKKL